METWRVLIAVSALLVFYAVLARFTGYETSLIEMVLAVVMGGVGLYLGNRLSKRLASREK